MAHHVSEQQLSALIADIRKILADLPECCDLARESLNIHDREGVTRMLCGTAKELHNIAELMDSIGRKASLPQSTTEAR